METICGHCECSIFRRPVMDCPDGEQARPVDTSPENLTGTIRVRCFWKIGESEILNWSKLNF